MLRSALVVPALTVTAVLLMSQSAHAQTPRVYTTYYYGYNPGYYARSEAFPQQRPLPINPSKAQTRDQHHSWVVAQAPVVVEPSPMLATRPKEADMGTLLVTVSQPSPKPVVVDVRGPGGEVRTFKVAGGEDSIRVRSFVLHQGERLTLNLTAPSSRVVR